MKADEFEKAIRDDPDNLDLRLIAADWYEELGGSTLSELGAGIFF